MVMLSVSWRKYTVWFTLKCYDFKWPINVDRKTHSLNNEVAVSRQLKCEFQTLAGGSRLVGLGGNTLGWLKMSFLPKLRQYYSTITTYISSDPPPLSKIQHCASSSRMGYCPRTADRNMVHRSQGVRHRAPRLHGSVANDHYGASGSTPSYACPPLAWGPAGGDCLIPRLLWD
jgi:hypothetical protein